MDGYRREALPLHIEPLQSEAATLPREVFAMRYPHPFLVYTRSTLWDRSIVGRADTAVSGGTQVVSYDLAPGGLTFLQPVRKVHLTPGEPRVLLGRSKDQDMVVPVGSISSEHLAFVPPQPDAPSWYVAVLKTKNGTWLNEKPLSPKQPQPLADEDSLRLGGNLIAYFLSPSRLWAALRAPEDLQRFTEI